MLLDTFIIRRLQKYWKGPAFTLIAGKREVVIGSGTSQLTLTLCNPWVIDRIAISPSLGFGEAYMNGQVKIEGDAMMLFEGFVKSDTITPSPVRMIKRLLKYVPISRLGGVHNAQHHYDIGNDFYDLWLDSTKTYTCAYFLRDSDTLEKAQYQKNDLVCKKVRLEKEMTLLDIGCGWGAALFHAALYYDADVTGITPAKEQAKFIMEKAKRLGIEERVHVIIGDWRDLFEVSKNTKYERIISIGMFEHVGRAQHGRFFELWNKLLHENGVSLLHTIGATSEQDGGQDPWIQKYIFPGGYIPLMKEVVSGASRARLQIVDVENLWQHYARTLHLWHSNVVSHREEIVNMFDERFYRTWTLYLQSCEAGFTWGDLQLYQFVILGKKASWPLNREVGVSLMKNSQKA